MKRRLFAFLAIAVIFVMTAITCFAEPNVYPSYKRYFEEQIIFDGGERQDVWLPEGSPRNVWVEFTCSSCGETCFYNLVVSGTVTPTEGDLFVFSCYSEMNDWKNALGTVNDTSTGCVVSKSKPMFTNVDYVEISGRYYLYVHGRSMDTYAFRNPVYGALLSGNGSVAERVKTSLWDNKYDMSMYAYRLTTTDLIYDLAYYSGADSSYSSGYRNGFYQGKIQGQSDANILNDYSGFFDGLFRGFAGFIQPILNIGIGSFTVYNVLQLMLTIYLALSLIRIIRG